MRKTSRAPSGLALDLLLLLFERPRGSSDLSDAVGVLRGQPVALATFYRHLQRAVDQGWVELEEPPSSAPPSPGRPGRLYRLSGGGERLLRSGVERQRRRLARAEALGLLAGESR
ncbi:MAG: hypothetical protein AAGC60_14300 [Acidobacteriota bacterium]